MKPMMLEDTLKYIRGFFDRLCYVDLDGRAIILTTNQADLAKRVGAMIHSLGIKCSITTSWGKVKLRVSSRRSLERWKLLIGFEPEKMDRLAKVLASYRRQENAEPVVGTAEGPDQAAASGVLRSTRREA